MLERTDPRAPLAVRSEGPKPGVHVETVFFDIRVDTRESADGQEELWTHIESRPAFEVAMLLHSDADPRVILMKKRRLATDPWLTKLPGGYLWEEPENFIPKRILQVTGIKLEFPRLFKLGEVIGHSEIKTPISLYYTFDWTKVAEPGKGIELLHLPLSEAVKMAMNSEVENDSTFSALMRLYYLWKEGRLAL